MKLHNAVLTLALLTGCMYGQTLTPTPNLAAGESVSMASTSGTPAQVQKYVFTQPHNMVISTVTPDAVICYGPSVTVATDGKGGCLVGTLYTAPIGVTFNRSIYAVAWAPGLSDSAVAEAIFTFQAPAVTSHPVIAVSGMAASATNKYTITQPHTMSLTSNTAGAIFCYSATNTPATNGLGTGCKPGSTRYTVPVNITFSRSIYIVAGAAAHVDSSVVEAIFTVAQK